MPRRFSRLRYAINSLKTATSTGVPSLPAGSPLDNFQKYVAGDVEPTYVREPGSLPGAFLNVNIQPFGYLLDPNNFFIVPFSKRVNDASSMSTVIPVCNHNDALTGTGILAEEFEPAKAIVTQTTGTTQETETSQITGKEYRFKAKSSYTIPYGKKTGVLLEKEVRDAIVTAVNAISSGVFSVNFKSEKI